MNSGDSNGNIIISHACTTAWRHLVATLVYQRRTAVDSSEHEGKVNGDLMQPWYRPCLLNHRKHRSQPHSPSVSNVVVLPNVFRPIHLTPGGTGRATRPQELTSRSWSQCATITVRLGNPTNFWSFCSRVQWNISKVETFLYGPKRPAEIHAHNTSDEIQIVDAMNPNRNHKSPMAACSRWYVSAFRWMHK